MCLSFFQISWWRHQMKPFSRVTGPLWGEPAGHSPHTEGQRRGALMFSLISVWTNSWANNRDIGDLKRHRAHYDVTVMLKTYFYTARHSNFRRKRDFVKATHAYLCACMHTGIWFHDYVTICAPLWRHVCGFGILKNIIHMIPKYHPNTTKSHEVIVASFVEK